MAGFTLILLSLFSSALPAFARGTLPDFQERRIQPRLSRCASVVSLFSAIVIHMGVALYTAAWVCAGSRLAPGATFLAWMPLPAVYHGDGVADGIYTMLGGLLAVVWTESGANGLVADRRRGRHGVGYWKIGGLERTRAHASRQTPHRSHGSRQQRHLGHPAIF